VTLKYMHRNTAQRTLTKTNFLSSQMPQTDTA